MIMKTIFLCFGGFVMKIAVTYDNGQVFQHFGHTEQMKIYTAENGKIISSEIVSTNGSGHGALADFLKSFDTDVLICGGIGGGAKDALKNANIELYGGVSGNTDEAVSAFLEGNLEYDADVECSHHHEHDENHTCGSHGNDGHTCRHGNCNGGVIAVTEENFSKEISDYNTLVVVDFWASWCGPCQMISPIIDELSGEISDVKFCKINIDEQPTLADKFNILSIPTIAFIKNNNVIDLSVGYVPKEELAERIEKNK